MNSTYPSVVILVVNEMKYSIRFSIERPRALIRCDAQRLTENAKVLHDRVEITFGLSHSGCASSVPSGCYAVAVFPSGTRHYLGPLLTTGAVVASARLVRHAPSFLQIDLHRDPLCGHCVQPPWPCEMLLKEHVKNLLDADEYCGSVPCSHVQNMVKELPFYSAGMHRFRNWSDFVRHFHEIYHTWGLVVYQPEQHAQLELSDLFIAGELRMVSNKFQKTFVRGDVLRDRVKWRALVRLRQEASLMERAAGCEDLFIKMPSQFLENLSVSSNFRALNTTNITHYLEVLPSCFKLLLSPNHPIRVEQGPTSS